MRHLAHDLRYAARSLAKAPLFTAVAIISLGLALALNTSVFALGDAVVHPYVPYPEPERIITPGFVGGDPKKPLTTDERFRVIRDEMHSYDAIASFTDLKATMEAGTVVEDHLAVAASSNLFDVLEVKPMLGRVFHPEAASGDLQAAVISFTLWNRVFGGAPLSSGLHFDLGHSTYTVVGVMPRGVHYPGYTDVWIPEVAVPRTSDMWMWGPIPVLRLRRGVTESAARSELFAIAAHLTAAYSPRRPLAARLTRSMSWTSPPTVFSSFLGGTVTMVLIIACANLATMMLARGMARRRETAIRIALGASRRVVIKHVLAECVLIVAAGLVIGVVLTIWALHVIPHFATPYVPSIGDLEPVPSWRVFGFALGATIATMIVAGAIPAIHAAATDPAEPMKESAGTTTGRLRDRYNPLIVIEVALSTTLLMCSALFVIHAVRLAAFEFRFAGKRVVVAPLFIDPKLRPDSNSVERFYNDLVSGAGQLPGAVIAATVYNRAPVGGMIFSEEGKSGNHWINSNDGYFVVSPEYLRTFRIPIVSGRDFEAGDRGGSAQGVVIIDERAATRLFPDVPNPVGRMLKLGNKESRQPWLRVIGVARDVDQAPQILQDLPPEPAVYVVFARDRTRARNLVVQGDGVGGDRGRAALALAVRHELESYAPGMPLPDVRPWLAGFEGALTMVGFMASLFGAFGLFGLALCAVGLYGVLAYTVSRRLREFAVRVALGARRRDVARIVVHDAAVTALAGVGIGAFFALRVTRMIADAMSGIPYATVIALVLAELVLFGAATLAALGPVRQATSANPVEILRAS